MCVSVHINPGRKTISRVGELAALCGFVVVCDGDTKPDDGDCLCGINVADALIEAGFKVWRSPHDSMRYECEAVALGGNDG